MVSAPFVEKRIPSSLIFSGIFIKSELVKYGAVYLCIFYSVNLFLSRTILISEAS